MVNVPTKDRQSVEMNGVREALIAARKDAIACVISLNQAIQNSGGVVLSVETMQKMSLMDFITTVAAQNNIRFVHEKNGADENPGT